MVDVITSLVAPTSWRERGGMATISIVKGLLTVTNTPEAHYEIVMLCERVRIARGLRPQGDLPDHIHDLTPRVSLALPKLAQPITASYTAPTRLTEILQYLGETSEMEMIVDWRALDEIGHTPESLAQLEVNEQSLSETLQTLLGPMELSFIVLDDHTLQITSAKVAFSKPDIELFRINQVAAKDGGQKVIDGVRSILGEAFAGQRGPSSLRFDGFSNSLIVAAPQSQIAAIGRLIEQLTFQPAVPAERPELPLEEPLEEEPAAP
jgi:hypothetical protein